MKNFVKILVCLLLAFYFPSVSSQAKTMKWQWAKKVLVTNSIIPMSYSETVFDAQGNSYITSAAPAWNGKSDVSIVKHNRLGRKIWEVRAGGEHRDAGQDIALDHSGNIWVVGFFQRKAIFGSFTLIGDSEYNMFLVQYSADGKCLAAFKPATNNDGFNYSSQPIGSGHLGGFSLSIDEKNYIYVSNIFQRKLAFNNTILKAEQSSLFSTVFVAKFDTKGLCIWAVKSESSPPSYHAVCHFSRSGDSYITANHSQSLKVGNVKFADKQKSDSRLLMAKINTKGLCQWIRPVARKMSKHEVANKKKTVIKPNRDSFYISGSLSGVWKFGNSIFKTKGTQHYLAKFNENGDCLQLVTLSSSGLKGGQWIWDFTEDKKGNLFVVGNISKPCYFGEQLVSPKAKAAAYLAKYNSQGDFQWVKLIPCDNLVIWPRVVHVNNQQIFLTGNYRLKATFGDMVLTNNDTHEIFIACFGEG